MTQHWLTKPTHTSAPPSIDRVDSWAVRCWINGALMTMQYYSTPRDAMRMTAEVGHWIEMDPGCWRSEDGRWLIHSRNLTNAERSAA